MLLIVYGDCTFRRLEDILPGNSSNRLGYLSENEEHAKIAILRNIPADLGLLLLDTRTKSLFRPVPPVLSVSVRPCAVRGTLHPLRCQCALIPSWSSSSQEGDPMVPWFEEAVACSWVKLAKTSDLEETCVADGVVYFRSWVLGYFVGSRKQTVYHG
jgi:hypothetical protein